MTPDTWDRDDIRIALESCVHCPKDIVHIEAVHVLIHEKYMFQFTECRKSQQRRLTLSSLITWTKLFN